MRRFFFDVSTARGFLYDYEGREFRRVEDARKLAELIALDLESTEASEWTGSAVEVRNVDGQTLFSILVQEADRAAA
jgi:hypothetical protein